MSKAAALPFDADARLTALERRLILAVERGEDYLPTVAELRSGEPIRGGLLRAIMLATPLRHHPANNFLSERRPVRVTAHGIRIRVPAAAEAAAGQGEGEPVAEALGADPVPMLRITGPVDLRDLVPPGGGSLPPVEICGCIFDSPIDLSRSRLHSLALRRCRFSSLRGVGARFDSDLAFADCAPQDEPADGDELYFVRREVVAHRGEAPRLEETGAIAPPPPAPDGAEADEPAPNRDSGCVIDLSSAQLEGGLEITRCYLRADRCLGETLVPGASPAAAAMLSHIRVRGRIEIVRSMVVGAVDLMSAQVEGDVWISGGKFLSGAQLTAFCFQLARIGGVLAFQAEGPTAKEREDEIRAFPVVVIGRINAISLDAGEVWIGEGYYYALDCEGWGAFPTINLSKADIGRSFKAGAYHEHHVRDPNQPTGTARIQGEICLLAANIGKNLEVHGIFPDGIGETLEFPNPFWRKLGVPTVPAHCLRLTGYGVKVDRRVYISDGFFLENDVAPSESEAGSGPNSSASPSARRKPAAIDLFKSTIGTGFKIGDNCYCHGAVRLNSCVIGREVIIRCWGIFVSSRDRTRPGDVPLMLDISETTVRGHVKIGRREPRPNPHPAARPDEAVRVQGAVSLENTNVQGSVLLGHVTMDLAGAWQGEAAASSRDAPPERAPDPLQPAAAAAGDGAPPPPRQQRVALNLRGCVCGSDLEVHGMSWELLPEEPKKEKVPDPCNPRTVVDGIHAGRFRAIDAGKFAVVDLRGLQCALLRDGFGGEWGLKYRLHLRVAGIVIKGLEPASQKPPHPRPEAEGRTATGDARLTSAMNARAAARARLKWLSFQSRKQRVPDEAPPPTEAGLRSYTLGDRWKEFWERHHCSRQDDFVPEAYEAFSAAYRQAGEDRIAEDILVEKKNYENALRFKRIVHLWDSSTVVDVKIASILLVVMFVGLSWWLGFATHARADMLWSVGGALALVVVFVAWPYFVALFHIIFFAGFRYGLSPNRALAIFAFCIFSGWFGVHYARNGGIAAVTDWPAQIKSGKLTPRVALVLDVDQEPERVPPAPAGLPLEPASDPRAAGTRVEGQAIYALASPCNLNVSSLVYALDVFIPLIDLDQERRCSIRDALPGEAQDRYFGWRLVKALYELLGWIITSLVILTITGVLRRDLER
jgi:hypothetical protein